MIRRSFAAVCAFLLMISCRPATKQGFIGDYRIGEKVQIGTMVYNVFETKYLVKMGDGPDAKIPKNRFFVVNFSAVNGGAAQADQSIPTFTLIDDAGASYNELDNGAGIPQWIGFSRKVRPAESLTGNVVFDVAPKHYKLRISDETDEHYALVDLPLSFGEPVSPVENAAPAAPAGR